MVGSSSNPASGSLRRSKWSTPVATRRARIEIIPLIDVMFFLLASFMMVSLSLQKAGTFRMDLPVATTAVRDFQPGQLNIGIEADGQVSIEKRRMDLAELDRVLRERLADNPSAPVYVTADRATRHGIVNQVLARVRSAGALRVAFVTDGAPVPRSPGNPSANGNATPP
jgi:biopolymer transport protein ExbD